MGFNSAFKGLNTFFSRFEVLSGADAVSSLLEYYCVSTGTSRSSSPNFSHI